MRKLLLAMAVPILGAVLWSTVPAAADGAPTMVPTNAASLSGTPSCASDGTFSVLWTVTTSGVPDSQVGTVTKIGISPFTPVTGLPTTITGNGSASFTQSEIPSNQIQATADVLVTWTSGVKVSPPTGFVTLKCPPPTTTTTTTPTTTTTTAPPTTTTTPPVPPTSPTPPSVTPPSATPPASSSSGIVPPRVNAVSPTTTTPAIAFTGVNYPVEWGIGVAALSVGLALVLFARRRSRRST